MSQTLQRARVRQLAECINSGIQPIQNLSLLRKVKTLASETEVAGLGPSAMSWAHDVIADGLEKLEIMTAQSAGTYCVGDSLSLADACLVPQLYVAHYDLFC